MAGCAILSGIAIAFLTYLAGAGAVVLQGEPDGHGGVFWGTALASLEPMEYAGGGKDLPNTVLYRCAGDGLAFGRVHLPAINYGCASGRLTLITLKVDPPFRYLLLKEETMGRFGPGRGDGPRGREVPMGRLQDDDKAYQGLRPVPRGRAREKVPREKKTIDDRDRR